jgi:hypothetical protein
LLTQRLAPMLQCGMRAIFIFPIVQAPSFPWGLARLLIFYVEFADPVLTASKPALPLLRSSLEVKICSSVNSA